MKKIAFVLPNLSGGGAENRTLCLAKTLVQLGHDVHLFILTNQIDYNIPANIQVHVIKNWQKPRWWRYQQAARTLKKQLDVLEQDKAFDLIIGILFDAHRVLYYLNHPQIIYSIRNTLSATLVELEKRSYFKKIKRYHDYHRLYTAKPIITVSKAVEADLINPLKIRPLRIQTFYNPFDFTDISALSNKKMALPNAPYLLHVGRFAKQKRHDLLFQAYAKLDIPHKLVLLTKPCQALYDLIKQYHLAERIILPGFQKNPYPWLKHASLLILCSDKEGLPGVLIEALACKTPVISTDCPSGPNEILNGTLSQCLIPTNNAIALHDKIKLFLDTPPDLSQTNLHRFDAVHIAKQYLDLADSL